MLSIKGVCQMSSFWMWNYLVRTELKPCEPLSLSVPQLAC